MANFRTFRVRPLVLLFALACVAGKAFAGPALDALDGRWTATNCSDSGTGTWTVLGNQIQFFWPADSNNDALEEVVREDDLTVETVVVSPDRLKGRRYRYSIIGDDVLIDDLTDGTQQLVHKCT